MSRTSNAPAGQPRKCKKCGKSFTPRDPRHETCYDCFRKEGAGGQEAAAPASLPDGYLACGYFDAEGNIFPELVTTMAEEIARRLGVGGVTSTQLRRFYSKAKAAEQRLDAGDPFAAVISAVLELKQHAANAAGKAQGRNEQAGQELVKQFVDRNVGLATRDEKSFRKGFLVHFQGVVAYFRYHNPKK